MSGSRVYLRVNRTDPDVCAAAAAITMTDLYEAMGLAGRSAVMSPRMRPLLAGARMAGPAVTAWCGPGDNLMMHRALTLAVSGDVLVVVCGVEMSAAQWGDLATRIAQRHLHRAGDAGRDFRQLILHWKEMGGRRTEQPVQPLPWLGSKELPVKLREVVTNNHKEVFRMGKREMLICRVCYES